jgi:hypothetical protein
MSARPMARVIQARIKTPLADEVSVGVVTGDETVAKKFSFVYPEGPAQPQLERI